MDTYGRNRPRDVRFDGAPAVENAIAAMVGFAELPSRKAPAGASKALGSAAMFDFHDSSAMMKAVVCSMQRVFVCVCVELSLLMFVIHGNS